MIATNCAGASGNTTFGGHSMIVDPWGKIVVEVGEQPTVVIAEIDVDYVDTVRNRIPVLEDRRTDVYGSF